MPTAVALASASAAAQTSRLSRRRTDWFHDQMALPADPDRGFSVFSVVLVGFGQKPTKMRQNLPKPVKMTKNSVVLPRFFTIFVVFVLFVV
jgi:hypothetical protein